MASYRFSAQVIGRSAGRSATAAAAYRAACEIQCERYGETHDYSRKGGVVFSEVMTPENAPDWMADRNALWNAVEKAETRKNAQLAREVQLSLPHELTDAQRVELVRDFVQEQFISRGMIADVNIHAPHTQGDDRNHHAHVMLTMRELTADGFHKSKATPTARGWNKSENIEHWREEWANHQNRALERHGFSERVDHRSYEAQGIDREPQQHMGHEATALERKEQESRIANDNRAIDERNAIRAQLEADLARLEQRIAQERKALLDGQQAQRSEAHQKGLEQASQLNTRHVKERRAQNDRLNAFYGDRWKALKNDTERYEQALQASGIRKFVRKLIGRHARDEEALHAARLGLGDIKRRVTEERNRLKRAQEDEKARQMQSRAEREQKLDHDLTDAHTRQEAKWDAQKDVLKDNAKRQEQELDHRRAKDLAQAAQQQAEKSQSKSAQRIAKAKRDQEKRRRENRSNDGSRTRRR